MAKDVVYKASHCAWQIHYHVVFPVKYRCALLDEDVTKIITETAVQISERYDIEFERIGCDGDHIHLLVFGASEGGTGADCEGVQEHYGT